MGCPACYRTYVGALEGVHHFAVVGLLLQGRLCPLAFVLFPKPQGYLPSSYLCFPAKDIAFLPDQCFQSPLVAA